MKKLALLALLALAACSDKPEGEAIVRTSLDPDARIAPDTPAPAVDTVLTADSPCKETVFEGVQLTHCIADPAKNVIRTDLAPATGEGAGSLAGWAESADKGKIAFAMNGGMYGDDLKPIGYFVENSDRLVELNRNDGAGNFHMKPNGVFFGSGRTWRVLDADTFLRTVGDRPQFGTQSGPMLVVGGKLHPEFQDNGPSKAIRNGVGVDKDGKAHFVISEQAISFGQFARYFRDELKTPNALYLDGNVSSLYLPASGRMDRGRVGPLLVVETK